MANYNPRKERSLKRRTSYRDIKQSFLIICEGENTEPDYFNAFRLTSASVKALGKGKNTIKLVEEAVIIRDEERRKGHVFDQYWVVSATCLRNSTTMTSMKPYVWRSPMAFRLPIVIRHLSFGFCCISISTVAISTEMATSKCSANR